MGLLVCRLGLALVWLASWLVYIYIYIYIYFSAGFFACAGFRFVLLVRLFVWLGFGLARAAAPKGSKLVAVVTSWVPEPRG